MNRILKDLRKAMKALCAWIVAIGTFFLSIALLDKLFAWMGTETVAGLLILVASVVISRYSYKAAKFFAKEWEKSQRKKK